MLRNFDYLVQPIWNKSIDKLKQLLPADVVDKVGKHIIANYKQNKLEEKKKNVNFVHCDFRLDNMAINVEKKRIVLFDWQFCGLQNFVIELSMFLPFHIKPEEHADMYHDLMRSNVEERYLKHDSTDKTAMEQEQMVQDFVTMANRTFCSHLPITIMFLNMLKQESKDSFAKNNQFLDVAIDRIGSFISSTNCMAQLPSAQ